MESTSLFAEQHGLITTAQREDIDHTYASPSSKRYVKEAVAKISGKFLQNIKKDREPDFSAAVDYLNRDDVRAAIHAVSVNQFKIESWYSEAIGDKYETSLFDEDYVELINELLEQRGLQTIVVSGLLDATDCNVIGTERWLTKLHGRQAEEFTEAPTKPWTVGDSQLPRGSVKYAKDKSLVWLKVDNAGHFAPADEPELLAKLLSLMDIV